jgi:O-antigen/teichoic acid export membrane protein
MFNGTVEMPGTCKQNGKSELSLSARVAQGGAWLLGLNMFRRMLEFGRTIILAHLLVPADFGLVGIAGLALSATEAFTETGFQAALIQRKQGTTQYLNTAWIVSVVRGLILTGSLIMAAPVVAKFFGNSLVTPVL